MEKFGLFRNKEEIGQFQTVTDREDKGFIEEFYAILMSIVPVEVNENLRNKVWSNLDEDFDFDIGENHYSVRYYGKI
ncbi:MAG: hypothetical protein A2287_05830 [Candidatus Melainabacteria bacterium RIFOXYA12_FULL_32_12]|nr:MAG: hypothetical protein A2255_08710 [Candidatus Melainabacteria bacterium RIFOXYA2_FULL_32_9]OGI30914.1 MAG: hypothetical protein A2287_05830 [Candidatus Melainabacteria bacterium RIFOXYA12_FULL_32_12]